MESPDWASLSDDELLEKKISQLGLKLEGTKLQPLIQQLYDELSQKGLVFHPPCHVGDEWFVPVGIPAIFIPFFLVHDRLRQLERKIILEVEGETPEWFMKLIRHEAAHAYAYAYQLFRKRNGSAPSACPPPRRRRRSTGRVPTAGVLRGASRRLVCAEPSRRGFRGDLRRLAHAGPGLARALPGWKALQKLEYVDELMRSLAGKPPLHQPEYRVADYDCLNVKLKTYYARKRKLYEDSFPGLLRQRSAPTLRRRRRTSTGRVKASVYLRHHRRQLDGCGLPVDEREKISRQQTARRG